MKKIYIFVFFYCFLSFANAETFKVKPTTWQLEKYDSTGLVYSRTLSTCKNGQIEFSPATPLSSINRFFALVTSAKISGKIINVSYIANAGTCLIDTFSIE